MFTIGQTVLLGDLRGKVRKVNGDDVHVYFDKGYTEIIDASELKPLPRKPQKRRGSFIPVGSKIITIEDVKRWQAMETRLDAAIAEAKKLPPNAMIRDALVMALEYIKRASHE